MGQEVKLIDIRDLVLWTENPRDPISSAASDQDIADHALSKGSDNWKLPALAKTMGDYFDSSELPTVVFHNKKPVVYDGNRRVLLGKIHFGLVKTEKEFVVPGYPNHIPCNVCDKATALTNVLRKHTGTGSWKVLERDIFLHKFMKEEKSAFLKFEEETKAITNFPELNQRYVKDEILKPAGLEVLGFTILEDQLLSKHNPDDVKAIIRDIASKVKSREMSTRNNRGKIVEPLEPSIRKMIDENKQSNKFRPVSFQDSRRSNQSLTPKAQAPTITKRKKSKDVFFGSKLYLSSGPVNNLYRDIDDLNTFYLNRESSLTNGFPNIIRMSLRLLCETAAKDNNYDRFNLYIEKYYANAKSNLSQDAKTTLANYSINDKSIIQLLHTGAHSYSSSSDYKQTLALSIIIGEILKLTHSKV